VRRLTSASISACLMIVPVHFCQLCYDECIMRWWLGVALVAILIPSQAVGGEGLIIDLSADQPVSCGNFLVGPMQLNGITFYKFATTTDVSMAVAAGDEHE
jgi:hypothetical protein